MTLTKEGRWLVQTATAAYLLDFDSRICIRYPGLGSQQVDADSPVYLMSQLRRDQQSIQLHDVDWQGVGQPMVLLLQIRDDGVATVRKTTPVTSFMRVDIRAMS